ncbi:MAG: hypothetical protein JSV53_03020 [candidate division WOR-3 bacterium]|nr:MAG: hypothetical protein JSV53_03020 [candidate division WOR-3 bacterium]
MRDFTLRCYENLCIEFLANGYEFVPVVDYWSANSSRKRVLMRHDVDRRPHTAVTMARCEQKMGIKASYYFRCVGSCYDEDVIRDIHRMGHEIGYHYEDLSRADGDYTKAIISFMDNLEKLRALSSVRTICMHGSPLSRWDNRSLWQRHNYRKLGIVGEPYLDIDFRRMLYLTDTGRRWNSDNTNVRDKVDSAIGHDLRKTTDIVAAVRRNALPDQIMVNAHPHRWNDDYLRWFEELVWQNVKNLGKRVLVKRRKWL